MKQIILSASFRENSTSAALAKQLFPKAELVLLKDLNIGYCRGCGGCTKSGICVIKDDMASLLSKITDADEIILAFPIYFDGLPAPLKAVIDRMQPIYSVSYGSGKEIPKTKKLHTVSSCGGKACIVAEKTLKYFGDCIGASLCRAYCLDDTDANCDLSRAVTLL